jgi:thiamine-phosphate pyrophosphorylase
MKIISHLHNITLENAPLSEIEQVKDLCASGADWVQLRFKKTPIAERLSIAQEIREMTRSCKMTFIINDDVALAQQVDADGVHLGIHDMPVAEARALLGADKIIGATANNEEYFKQRLQEDVDYLGVGPYRFTPTKENLSAVVGLEGLAEWAQRAGDIPLIAIGGILTDDLKEIRSTNLHGVAIAGAVCGQAAPDTAYWNFKQAWDKAGR